MTGPVIDDHDVTVWQGDARDILGQLPAGSVQCIVTSPPYYGLRDYGTGTWDGGDPNCPHAFGQPHRDTSGGFSGSPGTRGTQGFAASGAKPEAATCRKCGASRVDQQIGLEASPAEYVEQLRAVFAEARRVLADDGVMWLNLGDSYSRGEGTFTDPPQRAFNGQGWVGEKGGYASARRGTHAREYASVPPAKNLLGMPWRTAFALQNDGWYLRNDIIWSKPNAMPESVTDRLSSRHEHVFLFTRSRRYSFNLDAIREPLAPTSVSRLAQNIDQQVGTTRANGGAKTNGNLKAVGDPARGANPGDVWTISTNGFAGAHFATMPPELARRCIQAGSPEGGTVLDPFAGSGTTLMVARQLGRRAVGIELNPGYVDIIRRRIGQEPLSFDQAAVI